MALILGSGALRWSGGSRDVVEDAVHYATIIVLYQTDFSCILWPVDGASAPGSASIAHAMPFSCWF
jgi:hypothetical protein